VTILEWCLLEILSYGSVWLIFLAITLLAAYFLRIPGVVLGHLLVAAIIVMCDMHWIGSAMRKPDWNGLPDQDIVFELGMLLRILLFNTLLLPVSWLTLRLRRQSSRSVGR